MDRDIPLLGDATPVHESEMETIVKTSHILLGQNSELQVNDEVEKVFDDEKEKETMENLGLTRKSVGNFDSSQVDLLAKTPLLVYIFKTSPRAELPKQIISQKKTKNFITKDKNPN